MIKKVIRIKNIGRFASYAAQYDVAFRKMTIVFGENARGKTTLTNIFRSLSNGDCTLLQARTTLGEPASPEVEILLADGVATFKDGKWSRQFTRIEIFDSQFVEDNVYSGLNIESEHRRNLHRFVIGSKGVELARKVDELDLKIRDVNSRIGAKKDEINKLTSEQITADQFVRLSRLEKVDEAIVAQQKRVDALADATRLQNGPSLKKLKFPEAPTKELTTLLVKSLQEISREAEKATLAHISGRMDSRGESWITQGLSYIRGEQCPFCGQSLSSVHLIDLYRSYFDERYATLKAEISSFANNLSVLLPLEAVPVATGTIDSNVASAHFWMAHLDMSVPVLDVGKLTAAFSELRNIAKTYLEQKAASPLDSLVLGIDYSGLADVYNDLLKSVAQYNARIEKLNEAIDDKKRQVSGGSLGDERRVLEELKLQKLRFEDKAAQCCVEYQNSQNDKAQLETEKTAAKKNLNEYSENIFATYQAAINRYLESFGATFRVVEVKPSYVGGKPTSTFRFSVNDIPFAIEGAKPVGPSFGTALSAGDKTTLAFAFFLARLDADIDLPSKVIVFDDPVSSLDASRKRCTQQHISRIGDRAQQVVVLSHDLRFLRSIWEATEAADVLPLAIFRAGKENSTIAPWDVERATRSEYFELYFGLSEFVENGGNADLRSIARQIRPLLEMNLRLAFPKDFKSDQWLGDFIKALRDSKPTDDLYVVHKVLYAELSSINDYSKRYHHGDNPKADVEPINETELLTFVKRTLKLLGQAFSSTPAAAATSTN